MKNALILGAREGNIGRAISTRLRQRGWETVEHSCLNDDYRGEWGTYQYDVPGEADIFSEANACIITLGSTMVDPFPEASGCQIDDVIRACLTLPLLCARKYVRERLEAGNPQGWVVFIGSYAHDHVITYGTAYSAAKAGLAMATRSLAWECPQFLWHILHPYHTPGTPMWNYVQKQVVANRGMTHEEADAYAQKDLKRDHMLTPMEIARLVSMLLEEPAAEWLSGQGLNLYGGTR